MYNELLYFLVLILIIVTPHWIKHLHPYFIKTNRPLTLAFWSHCFITTGNNQWLIYVDQDISWNRSFLNSKSMQTFTISKKIWNQSVSCLSVLIIILDISNSTRKKSVEIDFFYKEINLKKKIVYRPNHEAVKYVRKHTTHLYVSSLICIWYWKVVSN